MPTIIPHRYNHPMPEYRRMEAPGGTFFLTLVTYNRRPLFADPATVDLLRRVVAKVRSERAFGVMGAVVLPDHRRGEVDSWTEPESVAGIRVGTVHDDIARAASRQLPNVEFVEIESIRSFFTEANDDLDGLVIAAEEGAAWNVLYPEFAVVVPQPEVQRPIGMAVRLTDSAWLSYLNRWLEFERLDGSLDRLRAYWIEGGGTREKPPRKSSTGTSGSSIAPWLDP